MNATKVTVLRWAVSLATVAGIALTTAEAGGIPISGMPVPELATFDTLMTDYMQDNDIDAAVLGISVDGCIVYLRGFGWQDSDHNNELQETAMMRLASVTKPITAAAIRRLDEAGFLDTDTDFAFDLGQAGGGILPHAPWPSLGDSRLEDITVEHLLDHEGGWDRGIAGDLTYMEVQIADDMGVASPPGRDRTMQWILGRPLEFTPGTDDQYSNIGYLAAGLIVEELSGTDHVSYIKQNVLGPLDWCPTNFLELGRTFPGDRNSREPWYDDDTQVQNVFDPDGDTVRRPDGGWDHEARVGQGGLISDARTLLKFLDVYYVAGDDIGALRGPLESWNHTGGLAGTNTIGRQRGDGINFAILLNKRDSDVGYVGELKDLIDAELDATASFPDNCIDGQWVNFMVANASPRGSYEDAYDNMDTALSSAGDEETLNLRGTTLWTGVIDQEVRLRAPQGAARIGG